MFQIHPKSHQTSRFPVTVCIHVSHNDRLCKQSYNFVVIHSNIINFLHGTSTCLVVIVCPFGTRNIIYNDVTHFYVQEYVYFKNAMFYKGGMSDVTKSDVITLKLNV